jgi:hypothetical protein
MMIWDLHCHLTNLAGRTPEERMTAFLEFADRMGIERVCVYLGASLVQNPTPERLREDNDFVLRALDHWHDRAFGFCYVSGEHVETSLAELDRCIAHGPMVGVKLWVAKRASAETLDPIVRRAHELKAVIFQHTWFKTNGQNYPGESTPGDLIALAKRNPKIPFICGHTGGTWEYGIRAVRDYPQISIDLAGSDPTNGFTEMAVRELGVDRVIYGSDAGGRSFASQLAKVHGARISEADKQKIFGGNLRRLLMPILQEKGVRV